MSRPHPALLATLACCAVPPASADYQPGAIAAKLQPYVEHHTLAGAVALVANRDKTLAVECAGWADMATQRPMRADTTFWIASMSKPITATAVMMLVEEGRIKLDDPVEKYLPEFRGQMVLVEKTDDHQLLRKPAHPITVRNVLSHTSGLAFSSPLENPTLDGLPLKVAVRSYAAMPLTFEPDTKYAYSNEGINTAARILEVVSGQSYEAFMQARLFDPLGMKDTTFWPSAEQVARLATAYKPGAGGTGLAAITISQLHYPLTDLAVRYPMPAGGLFATAEDMARFGRMILRGGELDGKRYLSEESVQEMTKRQTAAAIPDSYGLGWAAGGDWAGHGGALATNLTVHRRTGLVTVYLVQHAGFPGDGGQSQGAFVQTAEAAFGAH